MEKKVVTQSEFASKFRSKEEVSKIWIFINFRVRLQVYRFLAYEAEIFLPPFQNVTVWHLSDLASGKRKPIKAAAVKTISIPHFSGLKIETMLHHAKNWPVVA